MSYLKCKTCGKRAVFGMPGGDSEACGEHKIEEMIDVVNPRCLECTTRASFNFEDEPAQYCNTHKKDGMINVVNKKTCLECPKTPLFALPGEKAQYCLDHKKENMVDVRHGTCLECPKRPSFGLPGGKATHCKEHKKENMKNVNYTPCLDCDKHPSCAFPGDKPIYCSEHKKPGMENVTAKRCKAPHGCDAIVNPSYEGYCAHCFHHLFPEHEKSKNFKTKENASIDFIKEHFEDDYDLVCDRKVGGCSLRRPDVLFELYSKDHNVMVEIDEDGHKGYDTTCENKRICELYQDLAYKKLIILRFNTDSYLNKDGKRVPSCWKRTKITGKVTIANQKKWQERLEYLKKKIEYWLEHEPEKSILVKHYFFDEISK